MKIKNLIFPSVTLTALMVGNSVCNAQEQRKLPNILWITTEDNSPFLGCYGDSFATTPNLDKLASEGFRYTHAYANAPVCAPTRNTILTGIYATSGGHQHMRSEYNKSAIVKCYPLYLREAGYYCTNNSKTDYNINPEQTKDLWNESSPKAHYRNRKPGQPFFAVFNSMISHESSIHKSIPNSQLKHDPAKVKLPPYHPDTPEMRHDWAQYYDKIEEMDTWVGNMLKELEQSGEAENTIVVYYGDHGGVLGRSKRFVYESGTHVPFIIRIPVKYKNLYPGNRPGEKIDRLISWVDLSPTLLSISGIKIPEWMQGHAFLGNQKTADPEYAFMFRDRMDERYDLSRAVRDQRFRYIRNYMPYRIFGQHLNYLWQAPSMQSWERAYLNGICNATQSAFWKTKAPEELYDTENDPWEVNNLADNPVYRDVLQRMRKANREQAIKILDTGFIPEGMMNTREGKTPVYDYMRSGNVPLKEILDAAELASLGGKAALKKMTQELSNPNNAIRYWGATGLLILGEDARDAIPGLKKILKDNSPDVAIVAAEALYKLGEKDAAILVLRNSLKNPDIFIRNHALNAIDNMDLDEEAVKKEVLDLVKNFPVNDDPLRYDERMVQWLRIKWKIN